MAPHWWDYEAADEATIQLLEKTSIQTPRDFLADCEQCGLPFWARYSRRLSRFCSQNCLMNHRYRHNEHYRTTHQIKSRARQAEYRRLTRTKKTCEWCREVSFYPWGHQRYCSRTCYREHLNYVSRERRRVEKSRAA